MWSGHVVGWWPCARVAGTVDGPLLCGILIQTFEWPGWFHAIVNRV
jgi:hypothetical protein